MPDPISPIGSQGQLPTLVAVPSTPSQSPDAKGTAAGSAAPEVEANSPAATLEIARKELKAKEAPVVNLDEAAKTFREYLKNLPSDLSFSKDEASGYVVFKLVNPVTKEVIRQYPPDEVLEMARRLRQFAQKKEQPGILLDQKF